jgi:hypothetical protein
MGGFVTAAMIAWLSMPKASVLCRWFGVSRATSAHREFRAHGADDGFGMYGAVDLFGVAVAVVTFGIVVAGCASSSRNAVDAGADGDISRARAIVTPGSILPARPEAITAAQSVESLALKEGAGPRAVELHALAASVHERLWRIEHKEQDAKEALELYRAAGKDLAAAASRCR